MIPQSLQFILFCVQKMIFYQNVVRISKKNRSFWWHCAFHCWEEQRDLCRFWLWFYFLPWNSYKNHTYQPRTDLHFLSLWKTQVHFLWFIWVRSKSSSTTSIWGNTPLDSLISNLFYYTAEVHPSVIRRCTLSSASILYNVLQYLIKSVLCLLIWHDIIINESLKSDYLYLYVAKLIVSSRTLLNGIPCLRLSISKLGSHGLS